MCYTAAQRPTKRCKLESEPEIKTGQPLPFSSTATKMAEVEMPIQAVYKPVWEHCTCFLYNCPRVHSRNVHSRKVAACVDLFPAPQ